MLVCKYCGQEITGKFCTECGHSAEEAGVEQTVAVETETTEVKEVEATEENLAPVEDERMVGQPVPEEKQQAPVENEELDKARSYGIVPQILVLIASVLCCPALNVVSIVLSFISIAYRNSMRTHLNNHEEDEALQCFDKSRSAFKWSWITLIISLVVGVISFSVCYGVGFAVGQPA